MLEEIQKVFKIAYDALISHKLRAVLTILGITVGIAAVIVVLSAGKAIENFIVSQVTQFGTDYIEVEVKVPNTAQTSAENAGGQAQGITITTLKLSDAEAIKKLPNIKDVYGASMGQQIVNYQDKNKISLLFGVTESFDRIDSGEIDVGRFFTDSEDKSLAKVVVLGSGLKNTLFGEDEALGKDIKIGKHKFKIIGVMKSRGGSGIFSMDDIAIVPVRSLQKLILGVDYISFIFASMEDKSLGDFTAEDVTLLMRERHEITDPARDDFAVVTSDQALSMLSVVTGAIKILLFAIACISLIVGGVGIMNVMYVSVVERTFEIGLRKALGAKSQNILNQFLAEAVVITFIGGIIGIIFGTIISYLISYIANNYLNFAWGFYLSFSYIALAVGISVLVGLVSGLYPARTAAALDPIVALRKE